MAVLACLSDIRRLAVDAWLLPTDFRGVVNPVWTRGEPELDAAVRAFRADLPAWGEGDRVRALPVPDARRATPVLAAIPVAGTSDWSYHRETLRQFLDAATGLEVRPEHLRGRSRRLVAVPVIGTGLSGWVPNPGAHVAALLDALDEELRERADLDVVVVCNDEEMFSALQAVRRRTAAGGPLHRELGEHLTRHAEELAAAARRGRLVLFTGAGTSTAAGLPDWKGLLHELAVWAGVGEKALEAFDGLNPLDRAALVHRRKPAELAGEVARRLQSPHWALSHSLLAALPVRENVTVNYDQLFERAAEAAGRPVAVLPYEAAQDRWLLKLHGDVAPGRETDIVLSRDDYLRVGEHRAALTGLVQALLVTRHMLFVGFGLADDHLHAVVHDVRRALGTDRSGTLGTALLLEHDDLQEELWRKDLNYVAVGGGADATRRVDLFLDELLLRSSTSDAHLFSDRFVDVLTHEELALRDALRQVAQGSGGFGGSAWRRVESLLAELGWRGGGGSR